jgi:uncharacterized membrane protein YccC
MMQLSQRKTWSQEALDVKQHLAAPGQSGFFTYEKRAMLLLAVKTAMAAGICYWLARLVGLQDGYWGSISAIIVLQSNVGSTVTASRDRLIGTLIGAGFGAVFSLLGDGLWAYLLAVITAMVVCSLLGLKNSSRLAAVTVTILMLVHRTGSNWTLPLHRVIEVLLGIVVTLGISTLVLPSRARARLQEGLVQEFLLQGSLFVAVMEGFRGKPAVQLGQLRTDVQAAVEANAQLLAAARNEPSGSGASLEGLSLLHQSGRELEDVLQALELASAQHEGSIDDGGYAAQLEPELGGLARDIYRGFQYMAGCIHRWKFDVAPEGFSLEEDIAALEAKMGAVRPSGFNFPQEEILRAYAVQLHLKQLARLLRSSRVEASETVG